ncbi:MAG TPA: twin-arginine translocation signal domain-containing protein, partial [Rhizobiales bacterium]|nr:twin-arginine translocation signal domain-containing protein [Hyphomicrobiales bacterium]
MSAKSKANNVSRRKFLKGGAVATGAAAATVA